MAIQARRANSEVGKKYHCYIDGQGFIIQDESYQEKNVPFNVPRFATGDPTLADFSVYQYNGQTDWSQGVGIDGGQKYFVNPSQYWDSEFIDIDEKGEIKLLKPLEELVDCGAGDIAQIQSFNSKCYFGLQKSGGASEIWEYDGSATPTSLINLSSVGGAGVSAIGDFSAYSDSLQFPTYRSQLWYEWDGTNFTSSAVPSTLTNLLHTVEWQSYLYCRNGVTISSYDGDGKVSATGSWTEDINTKDLNIRRMIIYRNKLYTLGSRLTGSLLGSFTELIVYDGNVWETVEKFPNIGTTCMEVFENRLWFCVGRYLYAYDGVNISRELDLTDLYADDMFMETAYQNTGKRLKAVDDKLYLIVNDTDNNISELFMYNGYGWNRWGENSAASTYFTCIGNLDQQTQDQLLIGDGAGKVYKISAGYSTVDTGYVESSWFDFDQFNIEKVYANMSVYHEALPINTSVTLKYKIDKMSAWYTLGVNDVADTNMASWDFPANTKGAKIKYRCELATTTSASTPTIQDIIFKYRLTPQKRDTKRQWIFNVILAGAPDSHITLLDNSREVQSGAQLKNFLWRAKKKDMFEFISPQGEKANVVFEELVITGPYMASNKDMEYLAQVTLIEV